MLPTEFYKCLTDEIRLNAILMMHQLGELCVCELMIALNEKEQPKVSRNLAVLKKASIVVSRKVGQWVYYRINPDLPKWIINVIAQTELHNKRLIDTPIKRLNNMKNRPDKATLCG